MLFRLSDVYKSYGGNEILKGVSFQINPGEKVGLVGRNGAGKTTVFRLITQEESPDSGNVFKTGGLVIGMLEQHVDFTQNDTVHTAALSAFHRIHDIEAEMRRLELEMTKDVSDEILEKYSELQTEFEQADGFTYAARAEAILLGLGFDKHNWNLQTGQLSGGQKNRLGLARLLLSDPDILLLDEPTNHLDVSAVEWLENFLQGYGGSFVIISHDRYFLDRTCRKIIEIDNGRAVAYTGNYSRFLIERDLRREQQQREFENQQAFINKTQEFIRKNLAGQKTKQAKSRRNLLERMDRLDAVSVERSSGNFNVKQVERAGGNVLSVEDLAIGYGSSVLADGVNFTLHRGECLGIIGGNGTGKTTFLKTILGQIREIKGKITWGTKTEIGYYSQQLEDLEGRNEIISELRRVAPMAENGELRSFLARFLFFGDDVFKKVSTLSGGEKGRLALAKLIYSNVNVLALDEPTNHLDIPSREALEAALKAYHGTILAVSHDRYFLDQIATQVFSFEEGKKVEIYNGNYTEMHLWNEARKDLAQKGSKAANQSELVPTRSGFSGKAEQSMPGLSKNERQRIENRIKKIEEELRSLEEKASTLTLRMSQPKIASDHEKLQQATKEFQAVDHRIKSLFDEWGKLSESLG